MKRIRAFSLIELIISIVIIAIIGSVLFMAIAQAVQRAVTSHRRTQVTQVAESLLEEIRARRFDENTQSPWSDTLGPDADEGDRAQFDDVDDYEGYEEDPVPGYLASYHLTVKVFYADPNNLDQPAATQPSDYKRITATVSNPLIGTHEVVTIASRPSKPMPPPPPPPPPPRSWCNPQNGPEGALQCASVDGGTRRVLQRCTKDPDTGQFAIEEAPCDGVCHVHQTGSGPGAIFCIPFAQPVTAQLGQNVSPRQWCDIGTQGESSVVRRKATGVPGEYVFSASKCQQPCERFGTTTSLNFADLYARCGEDKRGDQCQVLCGLGTGGICAGVSKCISSSTYQLCEYEWDARRFQWAQTWTCGTGQVCCDTTSDPNRAPGAYCDWAPPCP